MTRRPLIVLVVASGALLAACSSSDVPLSTTSTVITDTTVPTDSASTTSTTVMTGETTSTIMGEIVTDYEIVVRLPGDNGETLYVVIPPGAYTDIDLENFIQDLRDSVGGLWGIEVFDNSDAVMAFQVDEDARTEDDQKLLDDHHLVSLVNGDTIRFQGPLSEYGEYILAS